MTVPPNQEAASMGELYLQSTPLSVAARPRTGLGRIVVALDGAVEQLYFINPDGTVVQLTGDVDVNNILLPNGGLISARNAADTADVALLGLTSDDLVAIDPDGAGLLLNVGAVDPMTPGQVYTIDPGAAGTDLMAGQLLLAVSAPP